MKKNNCSQEGKLTVCNEATAALDTNGVVENLPLDQIVLFLNTTSERQPIPGSQVTLSANTVLSELVTTLLGWEKLMATR